tara:strand:+ start:5532 stop:5648 length:117 start_codon:yes stop_codon:yes gene_type:complete
MLVKLADVLATGAAVCEVLAKALDPLNNIIARTLKPFL